VESADAVLEFRWRRSDDRRTGDFAGGFAGRSAVTERAGPWAGDVLRACSLGVGAMVALGFSRFAYSLLLPPMRDDLALTYAQAGSLNGANGLGYVAGAIGVAVLARRWGAARPFQVGLLVSALVLLATALTSDLVLLFLIRTFGGAVTAFAFILGAALAAAISPNPARSGTLVGLYMAGAGMGIVLSGALLPFALRGGAGGWREGWVLLGVVSLVGVAPAWWAAGRGGAARRGGGTADIDQIRRLWPTALGYMFFGAGYSGFLTFLVAYLRQEGQRGVDPAVVWVVLGLAAVVGSPFWGGVLARLRGGRGPALAYALLLVGSLPLLLWSGPAAALACAILFGGSMMAGPGAITIVARQQVAPASLPLAVAFMTVVFSLGQAVGPVFSGLVTDATGSVLAGMWTAPLLLGIGAAVALLQPPAGAP
jgi:predicted MFS family arabinose efflux permease